MDKEQEITLTKEAENLLNEKFGKFKEDIEKTIMQEMSKDFEMLRLYKKEIPKGFDELKGYRATMVQCMKEILEKQDELIGLAYQLGNFIMHVENYFLNDTPIKSNGESNGIGSL